MDPQYVDFLEKYQEETFGESKRFVVTKDSMSPCGIFLLFTFTPKLNKKKGETEDQFFAQNQSLAPILTRAHTLILTIKDTEVFFWELQGPVKFTGRTNHDEDPEDESDEAGSKIDDLFNMDQIIQIASESKLEIVSTEKANGKFVICSFFSFEGKTYFIGGSKNNHILFELAEIDSKIEEYSHDQGSEIIFKILLDVKNNLDYLLAPETFQKFQEGYSLCGELCDGQHFVPGDDTIEWFGFFKKGQSFDTICGFNLLTTNGLKTVSLYTVYDSAETPFVSREEFMILFEHMIKTSRCSNKEGVVLRFRNKETNDTVLLKVKSVSYIVKRMAREKFKSGFSNMMDLQKRFVDAAQYHGLNSHAAAQITNQLWQFAFWMIRNNYPGIALGHQPVVGARGSLENGFVKYWTQFLAQTGFDDIHLDESDFGTFNDTIYSSLLEIYPKKNYHNAPLVIFFQGIQGLGKSETAHALSLRLIAAGHRPIIIEQDLFWGCTKTTQSAFFHYIAGLDNYDIIILSRNNSSTVEYGSYLEIAHSLPSKVIFIAPEQFDTLTFLVALEGIMNRSANGDQLMVGRQHMEFCKVLAMLKSKYKPIERWNKPAEIHAMATIISYYNEDAELRALSEALFEERDWNVVESAMTPSVLERIHSLRNPLDQIVDQIMAVCSVIFAGDHSTVIHQPKTTYIALMVPDDVKEQLCEFTNAHHTSSTNMTTYLEHVTLKYSQSQKGLSQQELDEFPKPFEKVYVTLDSLVISTTLNCSAFSVSSIKFGDIVIMIEKSHITAKIQSHQKPAISKSYIRKRDDESIQVIPFSLTFETIVAYRL